MTESENSVEMENSLETSLQHENGNNSNEENNEDESERSVPGICEGNFNSCENRPPLSSQGNNEADNETSSNNHRKMFECDVCNMKFSNGANMRRHKMRHTGYKPYECKICQKRFFRKDHLAEHFTTHTKTLPYHCPICNRGFQRQIAMRAHFQNEHVGQNDMIKSCPLCSYRAGSMKNLRLHFLNSHGIDLDNPGPNMMNNPAVAAASLMSGGEIGIIATQSNNILPAGGFSDSGDSTGNRSADNTTPPMHFLTPHVEISMTDGPSHSQPKLKVDTSSLFASITTPNEKVEMNGDGNNDSPNSPQSVDSNSNTPTLPSEVSPITPSVSLIPIKQEPDDEKSNGSTSSVQTSNNINNLMKSSPLKTLLREDLKRRTGLSFSCTTASRSSSPPDTKWNCSNSKKNFSSTLRCFFCGILFPDQTLYFLHKGCHCESNPWRCNICGEQLFNVYEFNCHLLSKTHQ